MLLHSEEEGAMDYDKIERALSDKVRTIFEDYSAKFPPPVIDKHESKKVRAAQKVIFKEYEVGRDAAKRRYSHLLSHVRAHKAFLADRREHKTLLSDLVSRLTEVRDAMANGKIVLAWDVERSWPDLVTGERETREIGYTTYRKGVISSHNLRYKDSKKRNWIGFGFGNTKVVDYKTMFEIILRETTAASFYVGHSLGVDIDHLSYEMPKHGVPMIPRKPILDTFTLSTLVFDKDKDGANLSAVAAQYGVETPAPHCGGNDARYNMELLLKMIERHVP
jgi:hypothetical protein